MTFRKKVLTAGLTVALVGAAFCPVAFADTATDLEAARAKLTSLGDSLAQTQQTLQEQADALEYTKYQMNLKQQEIDAKQAEVDKLKDSLASRTRTEYKQGTTGVISMFLQPDVTIEDIVSNLYYISKVNTQDEQDIQSLKTAKDELASDQAALQQQESDQQAAVDQSQQLANEYQTQVSEAQSYYNQLDAEVQAQLAAEAAASTATTTGLSEAVSTTTTTDNAATATESTGTTTVNTGTTTESTGTTGTTSTGTTSSGSTSTSTHSGTQTGDAVSTAYSCVGCPYVYGATGPSSFDCSGLVCFCYGYARGRDTYSMIDSLKASGDWKTSMSELQYGDLVFPSSGHVGIYIGNGMMIHAPAPGRTVCVASVYSFYGGGTY